MSRLALSRLSDAVANRLDRRSFLTRTTMVGSALATAPVEYLLRPGSAYAAVCNCQGQSCACGSLCCDGYTELCCAIYGANACPPGSVIGGWWKVDGSSYCGGKARYYMDCHRTCGSCGCGGAGICSGACSGTACGCGRGRCDHRKAGCTSFRYGNCNNHRACIGPIQCRVITCTQPWDIEPSCSASAVRTDNNTRTHNRPCVQQAPPISIVTGDLDGNGTTGIGSFDASTGIWNLRANPGGDPVSPFRYGGDVLDDIAVAGDWTGSGTAGIGIYRRGVWHLSASTSPPKTFRNATYGRAGDIPVVGDWTGTGTDSIGVYRNGEWHLSLSTSPVRTFRNRTYGGEPGDIPVVGDWTGSGIDSIGIYRRGIWHLSASTATVKTFRNIAFGGEPGDVPVVGDWTGSGRDSIGIYRPSDGTWHLRRWLDDPAATQVVYGPRWYIG